MKNVRTVINMDKTGRIKLPSGIMEALDIKVGDYLELIIQEGIIKLQKISQGCAVCGQVHNLHYHKNNLVCINCLWDINDSEY